MGSIAVEEKVCRGCGSTKSCEDFYRDEKRSDGLYAVCKACHYVRTQAWRAKNRTKIRALDRQRYADGGRLRKIAEKRLRKYGLTQEAFDALLEAQGGTCPICLLPFLDSRGKAGSWDIASVDHCHETGRVRGILHRRCNLALELGLTAADWQRAQAYLGGEVLA